jgi:hypothetical protein
MKQGLLSCQGSLFCQSKFKWFCPTVQLNTAYQTKNTDVINDTKKCRKNDIFDCRFPTFYSCLLHISIILKTSYFKN